MLAGPNGAGKTTTARSLFENDGNELFEFINADEIARGLAPLHPETMAITASKLMLKRFLQLLDEGKSFAFETTGAAKIYLKYLKVAKKKGYHVHLTYLWLENEEMAVDRVLSRVKQGGHFVAESVIRRRYRNGLRNIFQEYLNVADSFVILNNSFTMPFIIAEKNYKIGLNIVNDIIWEQMKKRSHV